MPTDALKVAALSYIARGWSIIPLIPRSKKPAREIASYLAGVDRMTAEEAESYWTTNPTAGIAIICGTPSGLIVIDVDPRNGGDLAAVRERLGDGATGLVVSTGGGGEHHYRVHPGTGRIPSGKTEMPGVDRKGDSGYVVAPPSVHPDTLAEYRWIVQGEPGALPEWALKAPAAAPGVSEGDGKPWIAATLRNPSQCLSGQHETLVKLAWWLSADHDEDIAESILVPFTLALPLSKPNEPWLEGHALEVLRSAYAKRAAEGRPDPGFETYIEGQEAPPAIPGAAGTSIVDPIEEEVMASFVRADDLVITAKDNWIVEGIIAPACYTEVIGEVKKGKTTLTSQLIHSILTGETFLGMKVKHSPVVLVTEQAGLSLQATLVRAEIRHHPDLHILTGHKIFGKPWPRVVAGIVKYCIKHDVRVLFIDTLTRLAGIPANKENDAGAVVVLDPFSLAKAMDIACVFVRHSAKSLDNRSDVSRAGRGTSALTGEMDICLLHRKPGVEDIRALDIVSRLDEAKELVLRYVDGEYEIIPEGEVPAPGGHAKVADRKRTAIKAAFDTGLRSETEIADATKISRGTVRKYLKEFMGGMAGPPEGSAPPAPPPKPEDEEKEED